MSEAVIEQLQKARDCLEGSDRNQHDAQRAIDEAIAMMAIPSSVPAGWKLVPIEPTDEMRKAWNVSAKNDTSYFSKSFYADMLAAVPAPSPSQHLEGPHIEIDDGVLIYRSGTLSVTVCAEKVGVYDTATGKPANRRVTTPDATERVSIE